MWASIGMMRPGNCTMSAAGAVIGALLVSFSFSYPVILAALAAFLITGAGNVINDVIDVEADRINRPKRPIPSGKVSKPEGVAIAVILFTTGLALAALTASLACLAIAAFNSALLVAYSTSLQNKMFVGNAAVSFLAGSTFLFGGAAAGNMVLPLFLALLSGLATIAREIVKDLEDVEGDRKAASARIKGKHAKTKGERFTSDGHEIKLRYNAWHATLAACICIWAAVTVSAFPYVLGLLGTAYVLLLVPTDLILLYSTVVLLKKKDYGRVSTLIKYGMAAGLLAFLLGSAL